MAKLTLTIEHGNANECKECVRRVSRATEIKIDQRDNGMETWYPVQIRNLDTVIRDDLCYVKAIYEIVDEKHADCDFD